MPESPGRVPSGWTLVREAIDLAWAEPDTARRAAAETILAAEPIDVPDVAALRRELDDLRAARFT